MKEVNGDIWEFYDDGYDIVIPTNVGWRRDGANVMGRGVAWQAARKFPDLPETYGEACQAMAADVTTWLFVIPTRRLIMFPVKPLNVDAPHLSWRGKADPTLINRSAEQLARYPARRIALPLVGCGNGGLDEAEVMPILLYHLGQDARFTLVKYWSDSTTLIDKTDSEEQ